MPDVSVARAHEPWVADAKVAPHRESALNLIHQLLDLTGVTPQHKAEQLKIGLWKWTVAEGIGAHAKFNTRYFSRGVMDQVALTSINHEHVHTMRTHIATLLSRSWTKAELRDYLETSGLCCIVTVGEHAALNKAAGVGWSRYLEKGIEVWDRAAQGWLDLEAAVPAAIAGARPAPVQPPADIGPVIQRRTSPPLAERYGRLLRTARFASAAPAISTKKDGTLSDYFLIHDALVEERTYAVAYPHWSGKVDFALVHDDVPDGLKRHPALTFLKKPVHSASVRVTDDETLELAEELLFQALQKLREAYA